MKKPILALIPGAILAVGIAPSAFAQATFNFSSSVSNCSRPLTVAYGNNENCTRTNTSGATAVDVSAWSTSSSSLTLGAGNTFNSAALNDQTTSGFGAFNQTEGLTAASPNHAVDNITPGFIDMVLLNFKNGSSNMAVNLSSLTMNWAHTDSDISIFRWTGSTSGPTISGTGAAETMSATSGWSLVGNYSDVGTAARTVTTDTSISSSWWLISSFSSSLSGSSSCKTAAGATTSCTDGDDGFKIGSLVTAAATCAAGTSGAIGTTGVCGLTSVPTPGSLALLALPILGLTLRRHIGAARP